MKNLRKALAAVIGLSVMAMSVSAFAEVNATGEFTSVNGAVSADYSEIDQNKVSATVDTSKAVNGTEMTYLILNNNVTDSAILAGSIVEGDILYIDQKTLGAGNNTFTGAINLSRVNGYTSGDELPVGSYPIRVGYYYDNAGVETFAIASATMVVAEAGQDEPNTVKIIIGDVDGALYEGEASSNVASVNASDALAILNLAIGGLTDVGGAYEIGTVLETAEGTKIVVGDVDGAAYVGEASSNIASVNASDALAILNLAIGGLTDVGGAYEIGSVVSVVVEE